MFLWNRDAIIWWSRNTFRVAIPGRIQTDTWCICCSQGCKWSSWSGLSILSPVHCIDKQHNILMSATNTNRVSHFLSQPEHTIWVSRHRNLRTQYINLGVFLWKYYIIPASYKEFCKLQSFCLCTPLFTLTYSFFQAPTYWNCPLFKSLLPDEVFQLW